MRVDKVDEVQKPADLQPSRGFTEEKPPWKKWKYGVSGSCVEEKCFVNEERQQEATVLGYMVSAKWIWYCGIVFNLPSRPQPALNQLLFAWLPF